MSVFAERQHRDGGGGVNRVALVEIPNSPGARHEVAGATTYFLTVRPASTAA